MDDNFAEIVFRPTCSKCRNIIYGNVDVQYSNCGDVLVKESHIEPEQCPHCGRIFTRIVIPSKLPFNELLYLRSEYE